MQGVVVVCSILWDVFVRFVWYSCGVGRLPSSWHQMFPIPQAARKMEKNRIKITIKIPFCNIECVVPALQTRHLSLNKGLVPTAG